MERCAKVSAPVDVYADDDDDDDDDDVEEVEEVEERGKAGH